MAKKIDRTEFLDKVRFEFGAIREISRAQVLEVCDKYGFDKPNWILNDVSRRVSRGVYALPENGAKVTPIAKVAKAVKKVLAPVEPTVAVAMVAPSVLSHNAELSLVPEKVTGIVTGKQIGRAHV